MYRQSNYNYFIPYQKEQIVYYNAFTRNSFLVNKREHACLQNHFVDPISFELGFPCVFEKLVELGFFVEEDYDEIAVLRYKYNKEVLFCPELHIIICISSNIKMKEEYVETIKKHLNHLMAERHFVLLCIEWLGTGVLNDYDEIIAPLSCYIKKICKQHSVVLFYQMTIEIDKEIYNNLHCDEENFNSHTSLRQIEKICSADREVIMLLIIRFLLGGQEEKIEFKKRFSALTADRLIIQYIPTSGPLLKFKNQTNFYLDEGELTDKRWYSLKAPRLYQYMIMANGDIHSGKQTSVVIGKLKNDGIIEWKEQQRMQLLGMPWFETEKCRVCKHLFLLSSVCSRMNKRERINCCLNLDMIIAERIIIREFDRK